MRMTEIAPSRGRGFSLMETLLAITLFALVVASSSSVFSLGIQIWRRTQEVSANERKAVLALEKMALDIQDTLRIEKKEHALGKTELVFGGGRQSFTLPAIVTKILRGGDLFTQYGRIGYLWDSQKGVLCRTLETASDLYQKKVPACETLLSGVKRVQFRYWLYRSIGRTYSWYDSWDSSSEGLPKAIEVTLQLGPRSKGSRVLERPYHRIVVLPVGGKA